ncbi:hypothetical protein B7C42_07164 [Nocardia cerradoensis]|uniref:Uncharacterized protein n=1 Tax=Nocardia cerradoensis TaxID=85688 RepID=A0A231GVT9_9NOCA|nr:hypothetical protein B7C42_07164 [Nocardia cerradoensis]
MSKHRDHHAVHCHCLGRSRRSTQNRRAFGRCTGEELKQLPRMIRMSVSHCESGKRTYFSEGDAELSLVHLSHSTPRRREHRVYFCPLCRGWHLTSQPLRAPEGGRHARRHNRTVLS